MILRTNLLPEKYRCLSRNDKLIIFACLTFIFVFWISLKQYFYIKNKLYKLKNTVDIQIQKKDNEKKRKKKQIGRLMIELKNTKFPKQKLEYFAQKIKFFNEKICKRDFLWYRFFHEIETILPEGIWIESINLQRLPSIKLKCEAALSYYAPQFLKNLINNPYFYDSELGDSEIDPKTKRTKFFITTKFKSDVTKEEYENYLKAEEQRLIKKNKNKSKK